MDYIFGYGSLINDESRSKTGTTGGAFPVRVKGLKRGWYLPIEEFDLVAVAAVENEKSNCNGVIFEFDKDELLKFDEREKHYKRVKLNLESLKFLDQKKNIEGNIWTYMIDAPQSIPEEFSIATSYLDVILKGCIGYGKEFTKEFVLTTDNWKIPILNDRNNPKYIRNKPGN